MNYHTDTENNIGNNYLIITEISIIVFKFSAIIIGLKHLQRIDTYKM